MKMRKEISFILLIIIIFMTGCTEDDGVCVSSTGEITVKEWNTAPFQSVEVYDNINLILTQDSVENGISIEAGENLIEGITTELDSGKLVIKNQNRCDWLRSFKVPVNVYLTFTDLDTIIFRAAGNITCTNNWTNFAIHVDVIEGAGNIDLKLNTYRSYILVRYGTVSVNLTGVSDVTTLISYGFGPLHAENLISEFTYVSCYSPNDMFVYSSIELAVEIGNIGNVYYRGNPTNITTNYLSEGRLYPLLAR